MKTLYPKQEQAKNFYLSCHRREINTLDSSSVGTGKTVVAVHLARDLGKPVAVLCPKAVIPSWEREFAEHGISPEFILNFEKVRGGKTKWMSKVGKKIMRWNLNPDSLILVDEIHKCLPEGTKISTPHGVTDIQSLRIGDLVETPIGPRKVTAVWDTGSKDILSFTTENGSLLSSHDHKIFTEEDGWIRASEIKEGHTLFMHGVWNKADGSIGEIEEMPSMLLGVETSNRNQRMRSLQNPHNKIAKQVYCTKRKNYVQPKMFKSLSVANVAPSSGTDSAYHETSASQKSRTFQKTLGRNEIQQSNVGQKNTRTSDAQCSHNESFKGELPKKSYWRKRKRTHCTSKNAIGIPPMRVGCRVYNMVGQKRKRNWMANHGSGSSFCKEQVGDRTRRSIAQQPISKKTRSEKRRIADSGWMESSSLEERRSINLPRVRVLRISKLKPQKCWDIEVEEASCFFAEGVLVHNCKGPYTQNAQLVISLVQQGYAVHGMSATAAEDPTEMRALGYLLGLHSLNKPENGLTSWYSWMMKYGCYQDDWGGWKLANKIKLIPLRNTMYGVNCNKLTPADFPDSFRDNRVFVEPTEFKDLKKIDKAYEQLGLTPAIIDEYILNGTVANSEHVLVNILKARQLAESFKVPDIAEMAEDFIDGGNSVVIFVNFTDSLNALTGLLHCPKIDGNQTATQRQQAIDDFQSDKANCIVVNIAAGGTGLSLHDINGVRPRISLICPTFNAKDYLQVLGRIHRNGAKSDALQKVLVAAGTIEEHVMKAIRIKTGNLEAIHGA